MPTARVTPAEFIGTRLVLAPLPFCPSILLHQPTPRSGLTAWLITQGLGDDPPYWAYAWAGGAALVLHILAHPEAVRGRTVLDFGAGSGLVGIAAARAGATVTAFEPDRIGQVALRLNAEANDVTIGLTDDPLARADIVLAGDVFYDAKVAERTLPTLRRHAAGGATVLIGDPFRRDLPVEQLDVLAEYQVPDFGSEVLVRAGVFGLGPL
ncbi:class I SAM-dependent methyltransferase [Devosia oryzisoli]|uniref:class I SAM-dependent methyltransferase n=1 Tax=Devosia oryzisoli TaxID=2774138 RepID=UPI0031F5B318